jgi:hypothetical protein
MGRPVLKQLQFELRFDDPRSPEDERIVIRGDRDQLEALYAAVTNYVQNLLAQSPESFYTNFSGLSAASNGSYNEQLSDFNLASVPTLALHPSTPGHLGVGQIYLQPGECLTHDLFVGSLVRTSPEPVVHLSVLQLFDLATALEEYAADVVALPNISQRQVSPSVPAWAGIAAAVVLVVGAIPFTIQFVNPQRKQLQTASAPTKPQPQPQQSILEPSPLPTLATLPPNLTPPDPLPTSPGVSADLPTPGANAVGSGLPTPGANLPGSVTLNPGGDLAVGSTPVPRGIAGETSQSPLSRSPLTQNTTPEARTGKPNPQTKLDSRLALGSPIGTPPLGQNQNIMQIPVNGAPQGTKPQPGSKPTQAPPQITSKTPPNLPQPTFDPSFIPSPPVDSRAASTPLGTPPPNPNSDALTPPPVTPNTGIPSIPESSARDPMTTAALAEGSSTGAKPPASRTPANATARASESRASLFDTTPQVKEAREFFERKWKPPAGLSQTLQYSLVLDVDGSIREITPIGSASRTYVDRSGIPLIGEKFVSPNRSGKSSRIRIVLGSDGDVTVVAEPE